MITCVFFFSRNVLIRRLSTVDFFAHGSFASSRVGGSYVCSILSTRSNYGSHLAFALSFSFFFAALMFSFSGADGEPFTFYPVFPCSEIHSKTFPLLPCAIAVGGLKQSRLVWPPPIGASSSMASQQHHRTRSSVDCQMVAIRKVERFLGELKRQQIHRLFFGHSTVILTSGV